jgi:glutamate synthase domain-containing protein 3
MHLDDPDEIAEVRRLIEMHREYTGSEIAARVLSDWDVAVTKMHKVIAPAYRRVLELQREKQGRSESRESVGASRREANV